MLASKPLPEMDTADAALLSDIQTRYKGSLEAAYEPLSSAEEAHNALVRFLTVAGGREGSGVLDAKVWMVMCVEVGNMCICVHVSVCVCVCV